MSKAVWEDLSAGFRRAWCEFENTPFVLEIVAPGSFSTAAPPYDRERFELVTEVSLPLDPTKEVSLDGSNSTLYGWAIAEKREETAKAVEAFRRLSNDAGAALPPVIRQHIAGLCHWHMARPATWWIALLVRLTGEGAFDRSHRYSGHVLITRPFLLSVDAIEHCGLNTDSPAVPFEELEDSVETSTKRASNRRRRRGRPRDSDPKGDRKVAEAWETGCHKTYKDLAQELGAETRDVKLAIDRDRKRRNKRQ